MDWPFIIFFSIVILALVVFLVLRQPKEEKGFEKEIYDHYRKPLHEEKDIENEEQIN